MLFSVLNSERAIAVNIEIMRAFVALRRAISAISRLAKRLAVVDATLDQHRAELGTLTTGLPRHVRMSEIGKTR